MSKFTTQVRFICENACGFTESKGFDDVEEIITQAAPSVFSFSFPIFDESYRLPLEKKILRHYYTREICAETVGLWKLWLCDRLNMVMPYFNKLYESELLTFNPFYDVDVTRTHEGEQNGNENVASNAKEDRRENITRNRNESGDSSENNERVNVANSNEVADSESHSEANSDGVKWDLYSDTPQGGINGITADNDSVSNNTYLTSARKNTDTENSNTSSGESRTRKSDSDENEMSKRDGKYTVNGVDNVDTNGGVERNNTSVKDVTNLEEYTEKVLGKQGTASYSKMLMEFRETFINIDEKVIESLSDLFFGLWE